MSSIEKLVGREVQGVLRFQAQRFSSVGQGAMTIKQVADACEISKPTARKYLDILVSSGLARMETHPAPNGYYMTYLYVGDE